jgi:hypothetical protein
MGGQTFSQAATGNTPADAFKNAVEQARYDYGHAGYTGTIAEKDSFIMVSPNPDTLQTMRRDEYYGYFHDDPLWLSVDDKWGPAGCVHLEGDRYLFFGWASC